MTELGARALEPGIYEYEDRRFQIEVEAPGLLGGPLKLTVALFTDRTGEFYLRRAAGLPTHPMPEDEFYRDYSIEGRVGESLLGYLKDRKEILKKLLPGRWKTFGKGFLILYVSDNEFPSVSLETSELKLALKALLHLDASIQDPLRGGAFTFRAGFEPDIPPWHWSAEAINRLPPELTRVVVSYYHENPYLNEALVDLFKELAGPRRQVFLSDQESLDFLRHAFGDAVRIDRGWIESDRPDVPVSADQFLDGVFFAGLVAGEAIPESLHGLKHFELHTAALRELPRLAFYVRRLLDDEASWFNGEYEILSLRLSLVEIASAVDKVAARYGAKVMPLDRRFTLKVFRDEKFEYST